MFFDLISENHSIITPGGDFNISTPESSTPQFNFSLVDDSNYFAKLINEQSNIMLESGQLILFFVTNLNFKKQP